MNEKGEENYELMKYARGFADMIILFCDYNKIPNKNAIDEDIEETELRIYVCKDKGVYVLFYLDKEEEDMMTDELPITCSFKDILDWLYIV